MFSPRFQRPVCRVVFDLCGWWYLAWVWVEGRRRQPPAIFLDSLDASTGVAWRMCLFWLIRFLLVSGFLPSIFKSDGFFRPSWVLVEFFLVPVSLCPPPPFPRTTVRVLLPSLLTEDYFCGRYARPHTADPGLPVGFLTPVPVRVLPLPSLLLGPHHPGLFAP